METLKQMSMMAVLKLGISRSKLTKTVAKELRVLEASIKSDWTGIFRSRDSWFDCDMVHHVKIDWSGGEWKFQFYLDSDSDNKNYWALIKIKAGHAIDLGYLGGSMFLLPGKKVWTDDYKIVMEDRKVIFYGAYYSHARYWRQFKAILSHSDDQNHLRMEVEEGRLVTGGEEDEGPGTL
eukprot:GFUD01110605.1.p1 GENE.GFUD01110605.1~~GFUD01110605.1.p1  ORF type:complete len:179 (+),score=37.90 GFUD01110605.1:64-600(+)